MSFELSLRGANRIANLTCGRIEACYQNIFDSRDNFESFLDFLDYYASSYCSAGSEETLLEVRRCQDVIRRRGFEGMKGRNGESDLGSINAPKVYDADVMDALVSLAEVFNKCSMKAILLPRVRNCAHDSADDFMMSEQTLLRLLEKEGDCACLILQARKRPYIDRVTIFDVFPHFELALRKAESWPAVLFWDPHSDTSAFVPVSSQEELEQVFSIARKGSETFPELNAYAKQKMPDAHYYMHLSDLHFGVGAPDIIRRQLDTLVDSQLTSLVSENKVDFILTGDLIDCPTPSNMTAFQPFLKSLNVKGNRRPLLVLGNHDISKMGISFRNSRDKWSHLVGTFPKIHIADDINVIFMLFDSNTRGFLAQGEIGKKQMGAMSQQLSEVPNLEKYTLIAVLHHNVAAASLYVNTLGSDQWCEEIGADKGKARFQRLRDANVFLDFLKANNTRFVLHGHKHTPLAIERDGLYILSCGSSVGRNRNYVSYNMLKFDKKTLTCVQIVEQLPGSKTQKKDVMTLIMDY